MTKILHPEHMFSSLVTMKPMLTSFQCCLLKVFLSSGERTIKADGDVEVEEPQASQREKGRTKRIELEETRRYNFSLP